MSNVPDKLFYTKEHEWVLEISATKFRIGITDYAQAALGDIVYIQLPKEGSSVGANSVCGVVESTKSVSEIYAPITGTIIATNKKLDTNPEVITLIHTEMVGLLRSKFPHRSCRKACYLQRNTKN